MKPPRGPLAKAVDAEVELQLGRPPISKLEAARVRKRIYDGHPGLLSDVRAEERAGATAVEKRLEGLSPSLSETLSGFAALGDQLTPASLQNLSLQLQSLAGVSGPLSSQLAAIANRAEELTSADRQSLILILQRMIGGVGKSASAGLHLMVSKKVLEVLGRAPRNIGEAARVKQEIYRANPGLLTKMTRLERNGGGQQAELAAALAALERAQAMNEGRPGANADIDNLIAQLTGLVGAPAAKAITKHFQWIAKQIEDLGGGAVSVAAPLATMVVEIKKMQEEEE